MTSTAKDYWLYSTVRTAFKDTIKAGGKKTYTVQATGTYTPSVDALETGGNFGIDGMIAGYNGDSISADGTQWLDISGNDYHATNYGATRVTDEFGRENKAYSFDGTGYLQTAVPIPTTKPFTLITQFTSEDTEYLKTICITSNLTTKYMGIYTGTNETIRGYLVDGTNTFYGISPILASPTEYTWAKISRDGTNINFDVNSYHQEAVDNFSDNLSAIGFAIGRQIYTNTYYHHGKIQNIYMFDSELNDGQYLAIREYRKYAPNLVISSFTDLGSGLYQFTVENTGATDYTDVQIPLDVTALGLTSTSDSVEILNVTPIVIDFDTNPLYVNYNEPVTLNATITSDHPISKIEVYQNGVLKGEMTQV